MSKRLIDLVQPATREDALVGVREDGGSNELLHLARALDQSKTKTEIGGRLREERALSDTLSRLRLLLPGLATHGGRDSLARAPNNAVIAADAHPASDRIVRSRHSSETSVSDALATVELRELAAGDDRERLRRRLKHFAEWLGEAKRRSERLPEPLLVEIESAASADDSEVAATVLGFVALARGDAGSLVELALDRDVGPSVSKALLDSAYQHHHHLSTKQQRKLLPTPASASAVVTATQLEEERDEDQNRTHHGSSSSTSSSCRCAAACDGAYLYVYRGYDLGSSTTSSGIGRKDTLTKIGTGLYETIAGRVYGQLNFGASSSNQRISGTISNADGCFPAPVDFKRPPGFFPTSSSASSSTGLFSEEEEEEEAVEGDDDDASSTRPKIVDLVCVPRHSALIVSVSEGSLLVLNTQTLSPVASEDDELRMQRRLSDLLPGARRRRRYRLVGDGCDAFVADLDGGDDVSLTKIEIDDDGSLTVEKKGPTHPSIAAVSADSRAALALGSPATLVGSGALLLLRESGKSVAVRLVQRGDDEEEDWSLSLQDCRQCFGLDERREVYSRENITLSADSENDGHPVRNLLREDGGSWQSNGLEPHCVFIKFPLVDEEKIWSRMEVRPGTMRPPLYVPKQIKVFACIKHPDDDDEDSAGSQFLEYRTITININDSRQTSAWHEILSRDELFSRFPAASQLEGADDKRVVVVRIEFRSEGVNCKVRGLRIAREERAYRRLLWSAHPSTTGCRVSSGLRAVDMLAEANSPPVAIAYDKVNQALWTYDGLATCCRWLTPHMPSELASSRNAEDDAIDPHSASSSLLGTLANLARVNAPLSDSYGPDAQLRVDRRHAVVELHDGAVATLSLDGTPAAVEVLATSAKFPSFAAVLTIDRPTRRIVTAVTATSRTTTSHNGLLENALEDCDQDSPRLIKIIIANSAARDPSRGGALSSSRARQALKRLLSKVKTSTTADGSPPSPGPESPTAGFAAAVVCRPGADNGGSLKKETFVAWLGTRRAAKLMISLGPQGLAPGVLDACTDLKLEVFRKLTAKALVESESDESERTAAIWLLAAANERLHDANAAVDVETIWPKETCEAFVDSAHRNQFDPVAAGALIASLERVLPAGPVKLALLERNLLIAAPAKDNRVGWFQNPRILASLKDVNLWQSLAIGDSQRLRRAVVRANCSTLEAGLCLDALRAAVLARAVDISACNVEEQGKVRAQDLALSLEELMRAAQHARSFPAAENDRDDTGYVHVLVATAAVVVFSGPSWPSEVRQRFAKVADLVATHFNASVNKDKLSVPNPLGAALCDLDLALVASSATSITQSSHPMTVPSEESVSSSVVSALSSPIFHGSDITKPPSKQDAAAKSLLASMLKDEDEVSDESKCLIDLLDVAAMRFVKSEDASGEDEAFDHGFRRRTSGDCVRWFIEKRARRATAAALIYHLGLARDALALQQGKVTSPPRRLASVWSLSLSILRRNKRMAKLMPLSVVSPEVRAIVERASLLLSLDVHPACVAFTTARTRHISGPSSKEKAAQDPSTTDNYGLENVSMRRLWQRGSLDPTAPNTTESSESPPKVASLSSAKSSDHPELDSFPNVDVVSDVFAFLSNSELSLPALESERHRRDSLGLARAEALGSIAKQLRTRGGLSLIHIVSLAVAALRGCDFQTRSRHPLSSESIEAPANSSMGGPMNPAMPAHFTTGTTGASRPVATKLRAAAAEVIGALLELLRSTDNSRYPENEVDVKVGALRALSLDYVMTPEIDDRMLVSLGLPDILDELRDERRQSDSKIVAAARNLTAKLLAPERPRTEMTRRLVEGTCQALRRQAAVATAVSNAVLPQRGSAAMTGTMILEPSEDGGFLVAPSRRLANDLLAKPPGAVVICLWLRCASPGLIFAALHNAATFVLPSGVQAEVALLCDDHGRIRWTERTRRGTRTCTWPFWGTSGWNHVAILLKESQEGEEEHSIELLLNCTLIVPIQVTTNMDEAMPAAFFFGQNAEGSYRSLLDFEDRVMHAVWAIGNVQGVTASEATSCVGGVSQLEIASCASGTAALRLVEKRCFNAESTTESPSPGVELERINYDVLGECLRTLRSRSLSGDVTPMMLESLATIADSSFAPATARIAALRSLSSLVPDLISRDTLLLPDLDFLLRRFEDIGRAVVASTLSLESSAQNAVVGICCNSLSAMSAASKTVIHSIARAKKAGPRCIISAIRMALSPAHLESSCRSDGERTIRVIGAFLIFDEKCVRALVGTRVSVQSNDMVGSSLEPHRWKTGVLVACRTESGFELNRLERHRRILRGFEVEFHLPDSSPSSLKVRGASTRAALSAGTNDSIPHTEEAVSRTPRSPDRRPVLSAEPQTAQSDASAPAGDGSHSLDPIEALVQGLIDHEDQALDETTEEMDDRFLNRFHALSQLEALTELIGAQRPENDVEENHLENLDLDNDDDDEDTPEEFGLSSNAQNVDRAVFGIRHPGVPSPSMRIINMRLRQRLRRLRGEPSRTATPTATPAPLTGANTPARQEPSISPFESQDDYLVAVAIPKNASTKEGVSSLCNDQYDICCVPESSGVYPTPENSSIVHALVPSGMTDDESKDIADFATFFVHAVATVLRVVKVPRIPSPVALTWKDFMSFREEARTIESPHDHPVGTSTYQTIYFCGATRITISFDDRCAIDPEAYLRFYKRDSHSSFWGLAKYTGSAGSSCWLHNLVIPGDTVIVHFNSEGSSGSSWGYLISAKPGYDNNWHRVVRPLPTTDVHAIALTAVAVRALESLLKCPMKHAFAAACVCADTSALSARQGFLKSLARVFDKCKLSVEDHNDAVVLAQKDISRPVMCESCHDYANNTNETDMVEIPGAKSLIVSFDAQSVSEDGHDYLSFYLDAECTRRVPGSEERYSGSGHRWPGVADNPPLTIQSGRFWYRWVTDGSHTYWGWRMTVTPVVSLPCVDAGNIHYADALCALLASSPTISRESFEEDSLPDDHDSSSTSCLRKDGDNDDEDILDVKARVKPAGGSLALVAGANTLCESSSAGRRWEVAQPVHPVNIRAGPSLNSGCVGVLHHGTVLVELSQSDGWIEHDEGWTLASSGASALLRLLPRTPVHFETRSDTISSLGLPPLRQGLSMVLLDSPLRASCIPRDTTIAFEGIVLQSGSLLSAGFMSWSPLSTPDESPSSWNSLMNEILRDETEGSTPASSTPLSSREASAPLEDDDDIPPTNDEGAPAIPSQNIAGLWYCGRRLGRGAIPHSDGQCGPNDGAPCSSCARYTRARHHVAAEKVAREADTRCVTLRMHVPSPDSTLLHLVVSEESSAAEPDAQWSRSVRLAEIDNGAPAAKWLFVPCAARVTCGNGHELSPIEWRETFTCNGISEPCWTCRSPVGGTPSRSIRWECRRCNFDYCHACYESKLRQPAYRIALDTANSASKYFLHSDEDSTQLMRWEETAAGAVGEKPAVWSLLPGFASRTFALALSTHPIQQRVLCFDGKVLCVKSLRTVQPRDELNWQIDEETLITRTSPPPIRSFDATESSLREGFNKIGYTGHFGIVAASDVLGFRVDIANCQCDIFKNGDLVQRLRLTEPSATGMVRIIPAFLAASTEARGALFAWNFGQQPFKHALVGATPLLQTMGQHPDLPEIYRLDPKYGKRSESLTFSCYNYDPETMSFTKRMLEAPVVRGGERNTWDQAYAHSSHVSLEDANQRIVATYPRVERGGRNNLIRACHGYSSGHHRWKITCTQRHGAESSGHLLGICRPNAQSNFVQNNCGEGFYGIILNGNYKVSGRGRQNYGRFSHDVGTVYGVELNLDRGTLQFSCNGTDQGIAFTGLSGTFYPAIAVGCVERSAYVADFSGASLPLRVETSMLESLACTVDVALNYSESPARGMATVGQDWISDPSRNPLYAVAPSEDAQESSGSDTSAGGPHRSEVSRASSHCDVAPRTRLLESGVGNLRLTVSALATRQLLTTTRETLQSVLRSLLTTWPMATRPSSWGSSRAFLGALVSSVGTVSSLELWPGVYLQESEFSRKSLLEKMVASASQDESTCAAFVRHAIETYETPATNARLSCGIVFPMKPHVVNVGPADILPSLVAQVPPLPPSRGADSDSSAPAIPVGNTIAVLDHTTATCVSADGTQQVVNMYLASNEESCQRYWYDDYSEELPADRRSLTAVYAERDPACGVNAALRRSPGWSSLLGYLGSDLVEETPVYSTSGSRVSNSQSIHATASLCMEALATAMETSPAARILERDDGAMLLSALTDFVVRAENAKLVESLHGITYVLRSVAAMHSITENRVDVEIQRQLQCFESALISRTNARIEAEIGSNRKSVLLQMLVEAALAANAVVSQMRSVRQATRNHGTVEQDADADGVSEMKSGEETEDVEKELFDSPVVWSEAGLDPRLQLVSASSTVQFKSDSGGMREEIMSVELSTRHISNFVKKSDKTFTLSGGGQNFALLHETALVTIAQDDVQVRTLGSFAPESYRCEISSVECRIASEGTLIISFEAQGDGRFGSFLEFDACSTSVLTVGGKIIGTDPVVTYEVREATTARGKIMWNGVGVDRLLDQQRVSFSFLGVYAPCDLPIPYLSPFCVSNLDVTDRILGVDDDAIDVILEQHEGLDEYLRNRCEQLGGGGKMSFRFARTQPVSRQSFATICGLRSVEMTPTTPTARWWQVEICCADGTVIVGVDSTMRHEAADSAASLPLGVLSGVGLGSDGILRACGKEVPFGPRLSAGDIVDVMVDPIENTVAFWWNHFKIGVGVGPDAMQAAIALPSLSFALGEGEFSVAASLCAPADSVQLKCDDRCSDQREPGQMADQMTRRLVPGWLDEASLVERLLRGIEERHADPSLAFASSAGDSALVEWIDRRATTQTDECLSKGKWSEAWDSIKPTEDQLIAAPAALRILMTQSSPSCIHARLAEIDRMNRALERVLNLMPWGLEMPLAAAAARHRRLVYSAKKKALLDECVHATISYLDSSSASLANFEIVRQEIADKIERRECDEKGEWSTFSRAFRLLTETRSMSYFRKMGRLFRVQLRGEHALDDGGPYREMLSTFAAELQSRTLPLLMQTPNGVSNSGENRDRYMVRPGTHTDPTHLKMLEFLGNLMGFSLRNGEFLALSLAPVIWKILVNEPLDQMEDLASVDKHTVDSLEKFKSCTRNEFEAAFTGFVFTYPSADTSKKDFVEVVPDGGKKPVTFDNREEYVEAVLAMRVAELRDSVAPIRKGLSQTVPQLVLHLYTGRQLETKICGEISIDIALLKRCTLYEDGYSASDRHITDFWQVLEEMDHTERANFLRFTWGRTRLPLTAAEFPDKFKIARLPPARGPVDSYLPSASTCHFKLFLPPYSSRDILRSKLRQAIHDCHDIDNDV